MTDSPLRLTARSRSFGLAAKIGPQTLTQVLSQLPEFFCEVLLSQQITFADAVKWVYQSQDDSFRCVIGRPACAPLQLDLVCGRQAFWTLLIAAPGEGCRQLLQALKEPLVAAPLSSTAESAGCLCLEVS